MIEFDISMEEVSISYTRDVNSAKRLRNSCQTKNPGVQFDS